jgi:hypothetical protein
LATCLKCGAEAGFFKELCGDCSDTVSEDNDPAPADTQQDDDEQPPRGTYGCLLALAIAAIVPLVLPKLAGYIVVCIFTFGLVCS